MYRLCSLALRGTQPALALVVSVGNCSISAAYQLFDFPREPRIAEIRSWWKPQRRLQRKNQIHLKSTEFNASLSKHVRSFWLQSAPDEVLLSTAGAGAKLISPEWHLRVPVWSHTQLNTSYCVGIRKSWQKTQPKVCLVQQSGPDPRPLARWPFPTTSRHLGGSHPCITVLLNQRLNVQVVPEVGCHNRGIRKAHAPLSKRNNAPIVWGHKCLFRFKSRFGR